MVKSKSATKPVRPTAVRKRATGPASANRAKNPAVEQITPIDGEPWVSLADGKTLRLWSKDDEVSYNQRNRQTEKLLFFRRVFDFLNENEIRGDYHEYGCHRVRTFRMALTEARRQ